jgi:hypothetical protein
MPYRAAGTFEGDSEIEAIDQAIQELQDLLLLMAVTGSALTVVPGSAEAIPEAPAMPWPRPEGFDPDPSVPFPEKISAGMASSMTLGKGIGFVKRVPDLSFERKSYEVREKWPVHVRKALRLNYLARLAEDPGQALFLHVACLEILAEAELGSPEIALADLKEAAGDQFVEILTETVLKLKESGPIEDEQIERLVSQLASTHAVSPIDRMHAFLRGRGINVSRETVRDWWKGRGKEAHGTPSGIDFPDLQEIREALRLLLVSEFTA